MVKAIKFAWNYLISSPGAGISRLGVFWIVFWASLGTAKQAATGPFEPLPLAFWVLSVAAVSWVGLELILWLIKSLVDELWPKV